MNRSELKKWIAYALCIAMVVTMVSVASIYEGASAETMKKLTYQGEEVNRYWYQYQPTTGGAADTLAELNYSKGYFLESSDTENIHMATCSMNLAYASFNENGEYAEAGQTVLELLGRMGFTNQKTNEDYKIKPTKDTIGVATAVGDMKFADGTQGKLVPIIIRGGGYETEWVNNFEIGTEGNAVGFQNVADKASTFIEKYLEELGIHPDTDNVRYWVMGYSRGGAVADILSKELSDQYEEKKVFGYCFEAPRVMQKQDKTKYQNIHLVTSPSDPITYLAPDSAELYRVGKEMLLPSDPSDADYDTYYPKMKEQLKILSPEYSYLELKDFQWKEFMLGTLVDCEPNEYGSQKAFLEYTFSKIQEWLSLSREMYSTSVIENSETMQTAIMDVAGILFSMNASERAKLIDNFKNFLPNVGFVFQLDFLTFLSMEDSSDFKDVDSRYQNMYDVLWKMMTEGIKATSTENKDFEPISNFMDKEDMAKLKAALPVLLYEVRKFECNDIGTKVYDEESQKLVSKQVLGTLIQNSASLMQAHEPELNLSWLRAKDSYYDNAREYVDAYRTLTFDKLGDTTLTIHGYSKEAQYLQDTTKTYAEFSGATLTNMNSSDIFYEVSGGALKIELPRDKSYTIAIDDSHAETKAKDVVCNVTDRSFTTDNATILRSFTNNEEGFNAKEQDTNLILCALSDEDAVEATACIDKKYQLGNKPNIIIESADESLGMVERKQSQDGKQIICKAVALTKENGDEVSTFVGWCEKDNTKKYLYTTAEIQIDNTYQSNSISLLAVFQKNPESLHPTATPSVQPTSSPAATPTATPIQKQPVKKKSLKKNKTYTVNGLNYRVMNANTNETGTAMVTGAKSKQITKVVIGKTVKIEGVVLRVKKINKKAFYRYTNLRKVSIGENVSSIGSKAFYGDKKLKTLVIRSTKLSLRNIGKKAFSNISKKVSIKVPKDKKKVYQTMLQKRGYGRR